LEDFICCLITTWQNLTIQNEEILTRPEVATLQLQSPFKTPLSEASKAWSGFTRTKWEIGYRLIGPDSWTRMIRSRVSQEAWALSNVKGGYRFLLWRVGIKIPFRARISGKEYEVANAAEALVLSMAVRRSYQPLPFQEEVKGHQKGVFRFEFGGKHLAFPYDGDRYGTFVVLREFFVQEPYAGLDVKGLDVVDVGSSFGDTPIYFCLMGARRVYAFEPYPATYALARRNLTENDFDDRVTLFNEGAGASGWMRLTTERTNFWANAAPAPVGVNVRFNSLKDIIEKTGVQKAALKFHGEGSEYEFFESASQRDLAHFPQIVLKYHYGSARIVKKLKASGFSIVKKWNLHFSHNVHSSEPKYEAGMILARMRDANPI
jgi:FkbM family methyltransferase